VINLKDGKMPTKKKMRAVICIDLEINAEGWKHLVSIEDQLEDAADYFLWKQDPTKVKVIQKQAALGDRRTSQVYGDKSGPIHEMVWRREGEKEPRVKRKKGAKSSPPHSPTVKENGSDQTSVINNN
jgi:hypothetical protein